MMGRTPDCPTYTSTSRRQRRLGSMNIHHGTTVIELKNGALEGHYYTGRGRMTHGAIKLARMR